MSADSRRHRFVRLRDRGFDYGAIKFYSVRQGGFPGQVTLGSLVKVENGNSQVPEDLGNPGLRKPLSFFRHKAGTSLFSQSTDFSTIR
jgi:hypothetical protein